MELVIVNGSSSIARGLIRSLTKSGAYSKVRLLDYRPYRPAVYNLQRELAPSISLEKHMTQTGANIEVALEGADEVLYVTHDYVTQTGDKNNFLTATATMCKKLGVPKLVAVCPIEHELYYTEDVDTPHEKKNEAQFEALKHNKNTAIINTNLLFGKNTYFMHYIAQCAMKGKVPQNMVSEGRFYYNPIFQEDVATAIKSSFESFDSVKGQSFNLNGPEHVTKK